MFSDACLPNTQHLKCPHVYVLSKDMCLKKMLLSPTVYLEESFIKSGVFSVSELVRVSRSKSLSL